MGYTDDLSSTEEDDCSSETTARILARCPSLKMGLQVVTRAHQRGKQFERFDDFIDDGSIDDIDDLCYTIVTR